MTQLATQSSNNDATSNSITIATKDTTKLKKLAKTTNQSVDAEHNQKVNLSTSSRITEERRKAPQRLKDGNSAKGASAVRPTGVGFHSLIPVGLEKRYKKRCPWTSLSMFSP